MNRTGATASYPASRELLTPQRLRAFFAPKSIALVGASDNSGWARFIVASCAATGFAGPLMAVHPRAGSAFGLPVVPSLRDLPEPADLAFILAPVHAVEGVLDDMGAAGIPNAVVLASGYREVGEDGRALEDAMTARAIANGGHRTRPELPGLRQRPHPFGTLRAGPAAAADRGTGARRAAGCARRAACQPRRGCRSDPSPKTTGPRRRGSARPPGRRARSSCGRPAPSPGRPWWLTAGWCPDPKLPP